MGPPLDGYERGNLSFWLNAIVDPNLEIREGFQSYLILTLDGRSLNGMIAAQDDATVTLRNAENQLTVISRDDIDSLRALADVADAHRCAARSERPGTSRLIRLPFFGNQ